MRWRIVFAEAKNDRTVDAFECEIDEISRYIGKAGQCSGAIPITNAEIGARASVIVRGAGRLTMYAYYGNQCWWGGFLDNARLVSTNTGSALSFSGATFEAYLDRREMRLDAAHKQIEQTDYARMLWDYVQATGPGSDVMVRTDFPKVVSKKRDMSWKRSEARKVGSILKEICNREDGFEWFVDTYDNNGERRRMLRVGHPSFGRPESALTLTFPGNIIQYEIESDALDGATSFQARGKAPDPVGKPNPKGDSGSAKGSEPTEPIMSKEFHSEALLRQGYVRIDQTIERDSVTEVSTLDAWAQLARSTRSGPLTLPQVTARLEGFEQNVLGANITLRIKDFAYPERAYGAPGYESVNRVIGYRIDPGERGQQDTVQLIFEDNADQDHFERSPI